MTEAHPLWGRNLDHYPSSYTNDANATQGLQRSAVSAHVDMALRVESFGAMNRIRRIGSGKVHNHEVVGGNTDKCKITELIPLTMLKSALRLAHSTSTFSALGCCELVNGCIRLMDSMGALETPSLFSCEYGYLCFRICVIAMNVCLLKHSGYIREVLGAMASERDHITTFWARSAKLIVSNLQNIGHLADIMGGPWGGQEALFCRPDLKTLLTLLHENRKHFLIVLCRTNSLGLSGMMFVLWKYLATEPENDLESSLPLFSSVLWRYLIVMPEYKFEDAAICHMQNQITPSAKLNKQKWIDLDDSRNVMHIYINRITSIPSSGMAEVQGCTSPRLVEPLVAPGCEDLFPSLVGFSIRELWGRVIDPRLPSLDLFQTVKSVVLYFRDLFKALRPKCIEDPSWVYELVDEVVDNNLVGLAIRALSGITSSIDDSGKQSLLDEIFYGTIEMLVEFMDTVPKAYLATRFDDSGSSGTWFRYLCHFQAQGIIDESPRNVKQSAMCGELILGILWLMGGRKTTNMLSEFAGACDNPRCPMPLPALYTCVNCMDLMYCDIRCLATDWIHPWGGPHKNVCRAQSAVRSQSPFWLPKYYHETIGLPLDFTEGDELPASFVRDVASLVRQSRNQE